MFGIETRERLRALESENTNLHLEMQNHINLTSPTFIDRLHGPGDFFPGAYRYNDFLSDQEAIPAIHSMYDGEREWGITIGNIIDLRAAFVAGGGIEIDEVIPDSEREKAFADEFLKYNGIDKAGFVKLNIHFEKEGKGLMRLVLINDHEWTWTDSQDEEKPEQGMVQIQYFSFHEFNYEVFANKIDREKAETVKMTIDDKPEILEEPKFVYRRTRGKPDDINHAVPVVWRCLHYIIAMEKSAVDMRKQNHLDGFPRPVVICETEEAAASAQERFDKMGVNLKQEKILFVSGDMKYLQPAANENIEKENTESRNQISFTTGIPKQFLGDPRDIQGKSVSEYSLDQLNSISIDRGTMASFITEMLEKAMAMVNGERTAYNPKSVKAHISQITQADWAKLKDFFLPSRESGFISQETFLEKIPELDVGQEIQRLEEEEKIKKEENEQNQKALLDFAVNNERAERVEEETDGEREGSNNQNER